MVSDVKNSTCQEKLWQNGSWSTLDSGHGHGEAKGAQNSRSGSGYPKKHWLDLAATKTRTLRTDEKKPNLRNCADCDGVFRVCLKSEESGRTRWFSNPAFCSFPGGYQKTQGYVGFIVHESLLSNVVKIECVWCVSTRMACLILVKIFVEGRTGLRPNLDTLRRWNGNNKWGYNQSHAWP